MALLRLALCQLNPTVGDIAANERAIADAIDARARRRRRPRAVAASSRSPATRPRTCSTRSTSCATRARRVERLAARTEGIVAIVGFPERGADVHNAAAVLADGRVAAVYRKVHLPNYGVFDEQRYFQRRPRRRR